jgi:hypothetical protein
MSIDIGDTAASENAMNGEDADSETARLEVSRRTIGKIIGVASVGAATAGALADIFGALPIAAAETKSSTAHRLFPHTNGPRTPASYKGPFLAGVQFEVTTGGCWLDGFWTISGSIARPRFRRRRCRRSAASGRSRPSQWSPAPRTKTLGGQVLLGLAG